MQRSVFDIIILIALFPLYLISKIIPKDERLYLFGSSLGHHFSDNSKYLFLYVSENCKKIKPLFISKNKAVVDFILERGANAAYLYSFRGIMSALRAKKVFLSHSSEDIYPALLGGAEKIQLWHGTPLRMIGYDADWKAPDRKAKIKNLFRRLFYAVFPYLYSSSDFDKIVVSSEHVCESFKSAFNIGDEKIVCIGQPRNDCLFESYNLNSKFHDSSKIEDMISDAIYLISYLPTHRKPSPTTIVDLMRNYRFDVIEFNSMLKKADTLLVVKPHFLELGSVNEYLKNLSNIKVYDETDPYPLMRKTDILITDYSSVFFDFLLLNKPLIFAPFDYEEYRQNNADFYYDYQQVTPGPKCNNWDEVKREILRLIELFNNDKIDSYASERERVKKMFNKYDDCFAEKIVKELF